MEEEEQAVPEIINNDPVPPAPVVADYHGKRFSVYCDDFELIDQGLNDIVICAACLLKHTLGERICKVYPDNPHTCSFDNLYQIYHRMWHVCPNPDCRRSWYFTEEG